MKDKWDKLENIINEYENDTSLVDSAIQIYETKKPKKEIKISWKMIVALSASLCFIFALIIPIYFSLKKDITEIRYYDEKKVNVTTIDDFSLFVLENNLQASYLELTNSENLKAVTLDTNELGYFTQKGFYITDTGFDQIQLYVVVLENAEFEFSSVYNNLVSQIEVGGFIIKYSNEEKIAHNVIKVFFEYNGHKYYLDVITGGNVDERIKFYVEQLI